METLRQDLRYALRTLRQNPGFTLVATLALALGIGANSAIFSVVNAVLLRPLPYSHPDRLVMVWGNYLKLGMEKLGARAAEFVEYRDQNQSFEGVAAFRNLDFNLSGGDEPERIIGARVSANLFPLLGAQAIKGRAFLAEENQPGRDQVIILSHRLWQRRFSADPNLIGQAITLDGNSYTVVGIMPEHFQFPHDSLPFAERADVWLPLVFPPEQVQQRSGGYSNFVIARLKAGTTLAQAQAEMDATARRFEQQYRGYRGPGGEDGGWRITVIPLGEEAVGRTRLALLVLLAAVGFVLLIACANVANLLLARATARQKEIAIRLALGAGRRRVIRQLLTESLLLALIGGTAGLLIAFWSLRPLVALTPASIARVREISVDGWVVGFTFLVSLLVGVLFGLVPALQASKPDLNEALKEGTRSATASASRNRVRNFLVISEVALALVLLAGASLMIKSFLRLRAVELGFQPEKVLTAEVALPATRYAQERQQAAFYQQLLGRIEALPGVESASATSLLPLTGSLDDPLSIEGRPFNPNEPLVAAYSTIGPHYFRALGVPLLKGRDFTEQDAEEAPRAVIINQTMARQFWPGEDPIGKRFTLGLPRPSNPWLSVVGVVGDVRHRGLDTEPRPQWYRTYLQSPRLRMTLVVRAAGDPASLTAAVRNAVRSVDQDQPVSNVMTMPEIVAESISPRRFQMLLLGLFAALALILAVMGIYGVISYSVAQRTHEIGVRMALGARPRDVLRLIVGQGLMLALIGVGLGLAAAFALTRVIASLLYGVSATDPASFATTSLLLMITALLASYLPARRAMKIAPVVALRYE